MMIVRQHTRDAALAHRVHRNAIGEAITFVRSGFIQVETGEECVAGLLDDLDIFTFENAVNYTRAADRRIVES